MVKYHNVRLVELIPIHQTTTGRRIYFFYPKNRLQRWSLPIGPSGCDVICCYITFMLILIDRWLRVHRFTSTALRRAEGSPGQSCVSCHSPGYFFAEGSGSGCRISVLFQLLGPHVRSGHRVPQVRSTDPRLCCTMFHLLCCSIRLLQGTNEVRNGSSGAGEEREIWRLTGGGPRETWFRAQVTLASTEPFKVRSNHVTAVQVMFDGCCGFAGETGSGCRSVRIRRYRSRFIPTGKWILSR